MAGCGGGGDERAAGTVEDALDGVDHEVGHVLESKEAGTGVLVLVTLHFN